MNGPGGNAGAGGNGGPGADGGDGGAGGSSTTGDGGNGGVGGKGGNGAKGEPGGTGGTGVAVLGELVLGAGVELHAQGGAGGTGGTGAPGGNGGNGGSGGAAGGTDTTGGFGGAGGSGGTGGTGGMGGNGGDAMLLPGTLLVRDLASVPANFAGGAAGDGGAGGAGGEGGIGGAAGVGPTPGTPGQDASPGSTGSTASPGLAGQSTPGTDEGTVLGVSTTDAAGPDGLFAFHLDNGTNVTWMFHAPAIAQVTAALEGAGELSYADHTFLGWSTQASGGTLVDPAAAVDGEYFAQWQSTASTTPTPPQTPPATTVNAPHGQKLAATGTDGAPWLGAGLGLSLGGLVLAVAARLRRRNLTR
jgi:hypothetical protein